MGLKEELLALTLDERRRRDRRCRQDDRRWSLRSVSGFRKAACTDAG